MDLLNLTEEEAMRLEEFPICVTTELTNSCMLKCVFCPRKDFKQEIGFMSDPVFKKIVDECVKYHPMRIIFDKDGDPLLDPKIVERLKYIKDVNENIFVSFNTPAVHFPEEVMVGLIDGDLGQICFSLLADDRETYKKITGQDLFNVAFNNILTFARIKEALEGHTRVVVKMVDTPLISNEEKVRFLKRWNSYDGDGIDYVTVDREFDWHNLYSYGKEVKRSRLGLCSDPFVSLNVNWDGRVSPCCLDARKWWIVGDTNMQTLKEIWVGEEMTSLRSRHLRGEWGDVMCRWCDR